MSFYTVRPLTPEARSRLAHIKSRQRSQFDSSWTSTLEVLRREANHLRAGGSIVLQIDVTESQIRLDGGLYATAKPETPDVALAVDSKHGSLLFACGRFLHWQHNVRAIALGLEALRKVERYGIVQSDEQYRGWQALPPGVPMPAAQLTVEEAARELWEFAQLEGPISVDGPAVHTAYRMAMSVWHPDKATGDADAATRIGDLYRIIMQGMG